MRIKYIEFCMAALFLIGVGIAAIPGWSRAAAGEAQETEAYKPVIAIDPGHGGIDPGKVGINGTLEKEVNLTISLKLKKILETQGYRVVLTRDEDYGLYEPYDTNKKMADLRARCKLVEKENAELVISIHQNSFTDEEVAGSQVFFYTHSSEGRRLAQCVQNSLMENVDKENTRKCKANDSYYLLVHTPCPTVIVECGFLSNPREEEKLRSLEYCEKIAKAIMLGLEEYFH